MKKKRILFIYFAITNQRKNIKEKNHFSNNENFFF